MSNVFHKYRRGNINAFSLVVIATLKVSTLFYPSLAQAKTLGDRCEEDPGYPDQARQRVAWAVRCGHLSANRERTYNEDHMFPTFEIPGINIRWWFDEHAPCYSQAVLKGVCFATGCFSEDTQLLFSRGYQTLREAYDQDTDDILSLREPQDFSQELSFSPTPIDMFLHGPAKMNLIKISTKTKQIKVTINHPMVLADGEVTSAEDLIQGVSWLATVDGPELVESLQSIEYHGEVWNVKVSSELPGDNIHVAEGFITGGLRYQNQWTNAEMRTRHHLNNAKDVRGD